MKILKYVLISLASLLGVLAIAIAVVVSYVFNADSLTKLVRDNVGKFVSCESNIGEVDLTFFSSFPEFSLHLRDVSLVNPVEGAQSDTLLFVRDLYAGLDVMAYVNDKAIKINSFTLEEGRVNLFVSPDSVTNFDIMVNQDTVQAKADTTDTSISLDDISLDNISIVDFTGTYLDMRYKMEGRVMGLNASLSTDACLDSLTGNADLTLSAREVYYSDSLNSAQIADLKFDNCKLWTDGKNATLQLDELSMIDQEYLLTGDMALLAHIYNFLLEDIDLKWEDGKPTVAVLTTLDSAMVTLGKDELTYVTLGAVKLDMPVESNDTVWTAKVNTSFKDLCVSTDVDGVLASHLDLSTQLLTSTDTAFKHFVVQDMVTKAGTQTLSGNAEVQIVDSTLMTFSVDASLAATALSELLKLVPPAYLADIAGMDFDANLKQTTISTHAEMRGDNFIINDLALNGEAESFRYAEADTLTARLNDISLKLSLPKGTVPARFPIRIEAAAGSLEASMPGVKAATGALELKTGLTYDERKKDLLDMLDPVVTAKGKEGVFEVSGLPCNVLLPVADLVFTKDSLRLSKTQLTFGKNTMTLTGGLRNINDWLKDKAPLVGRFDLSSKLLDLDDLMGLTSGLGVADSITNEPIPATSTTPADADPFMVPLGVDLELKTDIKQAVMGGNAYNNIGGKVTCRDGVLVLEEVGFTSKAANMQLTALYKSQRRNNLFVGWNFHLLNIDIAEMIALVPEIDTIAPMIKAFKGKAEFHLAGETSLFADYSPKMSTLKAAAAIEGKDLTVLDNETFKTIKKYLFKESTTNKIDSMSIELAVARKKMTLYPMLVSWDKYQAVISGTHTVVDEMPFNYHISITKCPVVGGHLGLDISGDLDNIDGISYKVGSCKYANLYKPEKRNITQEQTLGLKQLISTSLKRTVK